MKTLNLSIIGCGLIATAHAMSLNLIKEHGMADVKLLSICDVDRKKLGDFQSVHRIEKGLVDASDIIQDDDTDAIFICTPTSSHKKLVLDILETGNKHIFCEKPLAPNLGDVEIMCQKVKSSKIKSQVGFHMRYNPLLNYIREITSDGRFGKLMSVVMRNDQVFPTARVHKMFTDWRSKKEYTGGGALIEHSIHDIDILLWLCGGMKSVHCNTRNFFGYDVEDAASVNFEFENGAIGSLVTVFHRVGMREERRMELFFEDAYIHVTSDFFVNDPVESVQIQQGKGVLKKLDTKEITLEYLKRFGISKINFPFLQYLSDLSFIRSILNDLQPKPDFQDGLRAHKIVDAAYRSAESGKVVRFENAG